MALKWNKTRLRKLVHERLDAGDSDEAVCDVVTKQFSGIDPATLVVILQLVIELIRLWRNRKK